MPTESNGLQVVGLDAYSEAYPYACVGASLA